MLRTTINALLSDPVLFSRFVDIMKRGTAVLPTDTLYGLAADADSIDGVASIYRIKGREDTKPLILFLERIDRLMEINITPTQESRELLEQHWPGALTAVFPLNGKPLAAFSHTSLGVRVPAHTDLLRLLAAYPGRLLTTSANRSGQAPMCDPDAIEREFSGELDILVDGGCLESSEPSTVIGLDIWPPRILRAGKIHF
ncbi:MAG: threonylcarbamoyl-AMP synthase [Candidatus Riflebacteria bacterium]|nr:threonylcarbamoyl-AMP synthase [Candidatus Riflebacteria bacterium]